MTCSAARLLIVAWAVGLLTTTISGSEVVGWVAAGVAVAMAVAIERWKPGRFGASSCAVQPRYDDAEHTST